MSKNRERDRQRAEFLKYDNDFRYRNKKYKNALQHLLCNSSTFGKNLNTRVSLGKYIKNEFNASYNENRSLWQLNNDSLSRFPKLISNNNLQAKPTVPNKENLEEPTTNQAERKILLSQLHNQPPQPGLKKLKLEDPSTIYLSDFKSKQDLSMYNHTKNVKKEALSKKTSRKLGDMVNTMKPIKEDIENRDMNIPFEGMILVNNVLRPKPKKSEISQNNQILNFLRNSEKNMNSIKVQSQVSIIFKDNDHYRADILKMNQGRNFCDHPFQKQPNLPIPSKTENISILPKNGHKPLYEKNQIQFSNEILITENKPEPENKISVDRFKEWKTQRQQKSASKNLRVVKIGYRRRGLLGNLGMSKSYSETQLLDHERPTSGISENSKSKWMDLIDSLLKIEDLSKIENIGFYKPILKLISAGEESREHLLEVIFQKIKFDILSSTKFAFVFRHY
jgi:hypothetical protein